jgi:hypothetical protein
MNGRASQLVAWSIFVVMILVPPPSHLRSVAITGLAVMNMVLSLGLALWPTAWTSAAR